MVGRPDLKMGRRETGAESLILVVVLGLIEVVRVLYEASLRDVLKIEGTSDSAVMLMSRL